MGKKRKRQTATSITTGTCSKQQSNERKKRNKRNKKIKVNSIKVGNTSTVAVPKGKVIPKPFPRNINLPKTTSFLSNVNKDYKEAYNAALETCYEGYAQDVELFENDDFIKNAFEILNGHGFFRTDITQPFGLGTKCAKTYVTRCLVGDEGTTYKYLGLRMFAHSWNSTRSTADSTTSTQSCTDISNAMQALKDLNGKLTERTQDHLFTLADRRKEEIISTTKARYNITLINKMQYSKDLKVEPMEQKSKCSVSWHADSSLEHYSNIAVYHTFIPSPADALSQTTQEASKHWSIALRVAPHSEGPTQSTKLTSFEKQLSESSPMLQIQLPSNSAYYLLHDFNHHHQHAVLSSNATKSFTRYASTHRLLRQGHSIHFLLQRCRTTCSQFHKKGVKQWKSEQLLLYHIEHEWIRQFYIQGQGHYDLLWNDWEIHICSLLYYWSLLEQRTKQVLDLLFLAAFSHYSSTHTETTSGTYTATSSTTINNNKLYKKARKAHDTLLQLQARSSSASTNNDLITLIYQPMIQLLKEKQSMRTLWKQREQDTVFTKISKEYTPLQLPFLFDSLEKVSDKTAKLGISPLPLDLYDIHNKLELFSNVFTFQNHKQLPPLPLFVIKIQESAAVSQEAPKETNENREQEYIQETTLNSKHKQNVEWKGWSNKTKSFALEMQQPWCTKLLQHHKTIETRTYPLPKPLLNQKIYLISSKQPCSPGISSLQNIITFEDITIEGWVIFDQVKIYNTKEQFELDSNCHLVNSKDDKYGWNDNNVLLYGWVVKQISKNCYTKNICELIRRMRSLFEVVHVENKIPSKKNN